jgi:hypothetical protein
VSLTIDLDGTTLSSRAVETVAGGAAVRVTGIGAELWRARS